MLVKLSLSQWSPYRQDREKSEELAKASDTTVDWLRANKTLVSKSAIDPITSAFTAIRLFHYGLTLPWTDDGWRVLPTAIYDAYRAGVEERKDKAMGLVYELNRSFPRLKEEAKGHLNGSYHDEDYPTNLLDHYGVRMDVQPIPQGDNLRVAVDKDELRRLQKNIESRVQAKMNGAMMDLWERLRKAVDYAAARLSDPKARIYDTLVTNIKDLVEVLPNLNITGDPELDRMASDVKEQLTSFRPDALRRSAVARAKVAAKAKDALKKIDSCIERGRKIDLDLE